MTDASRSTRRFAGVRYLVTDRLLQPPWPSPVLTTRTSVITENPRAMPLTFPTTEVRAFDDPNAVLNEILDGSTDLAEVALLEQPVEPLPMGDVDPSARGVVADVTGVPSRYRMRVHAPGPRQLVLTETYHPQWQCLVNGHPVPVFQTDRWFMSVRVPAGDYEVVWRFTPTRFRQGMVVSVVALMIVLGALLVVWRRARRSRAGGWPPRRRGPTARRRRTAPRPGSRRTRRTPGRDSRRRRP